MFSSDLLIGKLLIGRERGLSGNTGMHFLEELRFIQVVRCIRIADTLQC